MKNMQEWTEEVNKTRAGMVNWAHGNKTTWKAHSIFLGVLTLFLFISLFFEKIMGYRIFTVVTRIMFVLLLYQAARIIWSKIKQRKKYHWRKQK